MIQHSHPICVFQSLISRKRLFLNFKFCPEHMFASTLIWGLNSFTQLFAFAFSFLGSCSFLQMVHTVQRSRSVFCASDARNGLTFTVLFFQAVFLSSFVHVLIRMVCNVKMFLLFQNFFFSVYCFSSNISHLHKNDFLSLFF